MKRHIMSLTLALSMFLSVSPAIYAQSQPSIQEVQMKQPKAQPEDAADKAASDGGASQAEASGSSTDDMLKDAEAEGATDEDKPAVAPGQQSEDVGIYKSAKSTALPIVADRIS